MTEDIKITIRMSPEEVQTIEDFMDENGIGTKSDFIRAASRGYIEAQTNPVSAESTEGGIFVRLGEVHMETLELLKQDGICFDTEEFARKCILDRIVTPETEKDSIDRAVKAAQLASRMK